MNDDQILRDIASVEDDLAEVRVKIEAERPQALALVGPSEARLILNTLEKQRGDLESELFVLRRERACELLHFRLSGPRTSDGTIQLRLIAKLLAPLNEALESSAWRAHDRRGLSDTIDEEFSRMLDLRLAGIDVGSVDLQIVGNTAPDLAGSSPLESGIRNTFSLLTAEPDDFADSVTAIGYRATNAIRSLVSVLARESMTASLKWTAPGLVQHYWSARPSDLSALLVRLDDVSEPTIVQETIQALVIVLSLRGRIELRDTRTEQKIVAEYARSVGESVKQLRLGDVRAFALERTTYEFDKGRKRKDTYRLLEVIEKWTAPSASESANA